MKKLLLIALIFSLCNSAIAQQAFSSLEEQMTGKEFESAGLKKLSAEELATLNAWIRSRSLATVDSTKPVAGASDTRGFEQKDIKNMDRKPITSRIVGSFTGWDGQAVFKLENGMIWEQIDKDKFYVRALENPTVTIEPRAFKKWELSVEGHSSKCRVKRIQ